MDSWAVAGIVGLLWFSTVIVTCVVVLLIDAANRKGGDE